MLGGGGVPVPQQIVTNVPLGLDRGVIDPVSFQMPELAITLWLISFWAAP